MRTNQIIVVKVGINPAPQRLSVSETKNTASNTSSAGWISNGFDKANKVLGGLAWAKRVSQSFQTRRAQNKP
jgi:hypothetical protein